VVCVCEGVGVWCVCVWVCVGVGVWCVCRWLCGVCVCVVVWCLCVCGCEFGCVCVCVCLQAWPTIYAVRSGAAVESRNILAEFDRHSRGQTDRWVTFSFGQKEIRPNFSVILCIRLWYFICWRPARNLRAPTKTYFSLHFSSPLL